MAAFHAAGRLRLEWTNLHDSIILALDGLDDRRFMSALGWLFDDADFVAPVLPSALPS